MLKGSECSKTFREIDLAELKMEYTIGKGLSDFTPTFVYRR